MAIEKTRLNAQSIAQIGQKYGLCLQDAQRMPMGSANCYRVRDGERTFFLKELQSDIPGEAIAREAALTDHLRQRGIPTARFLRTQDGAAFVMHQGCAVCIEEYIEGIACGYDEFPPEMLGEAAALLGRLHTAMRDVELPVDMNAAWLDAFCAEQLAAQYAELEELAQRLPESETHTRLIQDLRYKKALAYRCEAYKCYYEGVTYTPTHGDYQGCQLILSPETRKICAVIDFSSARTLPVVWEIMRSFVQSDQACRKSAVIDAQRLRAYVRTYSRHAPLTRRDLASAPYVYLFQLARSRFGYTEYLKSESEDREGLLHFAFWRTQMCRELEARAEELAQMLLAERESGPI